jgi:hypothetical protein
VTRGGRAPGDVHWCRTAPVALDRSLYPSSSLPCQAGVSNHTRPHSCSARIGAARVAPNTRARPGHRFPLVLAFADMHLRDFECGLSQLTRPDGRLRPASASSERCGRRTWHGSKLQMTGSRSGVLRTGNPTAGAYSWSTSARRSGMYHGRDCYSVQHPAFLDGPARGSDTSEWFRATDARNARGGGRGALPALRWQLTHRGLGLPALRLWVSWPGRRSSRSRTRSE